MRACEIAIVPTGIVCVTRVPLAMMPFIVRAASVSRFTLLWSARRLVCLRPIICGRSVPVRLRGSGNRPDK